MNQYDEIKKLLKLSKGMLIEQVEDERINTAKDIEDRIEADQVEPEKSMNFEQDYRVSGGLIRMYGDTKQQTEITTLEKETFQETMEEFVAEVTELVDFDTLIVYPNTVTWSGKIIESNIEFNFTIGEENGVYINGDMMKLDDELLDLIQKLKQFYVKFKTKWGKVLGSRKKTESQGNE
jgi:hypothetical protein